MKLHFITHHLDMPISLCMYIIGAVGSIAGIIGTAVAGWYVKLATIDPQDLAIQPLHVVLIGFIIALATFIVLILRAVWGKGVQTVDGFTNALNNQSDQIGQLIDLQTKRVEKLEGLAFDSLQHSHLSSAPHAGRDRG